MRFPPEPVTDAHLAEWGALEQAATGGLWTLLRDDDAGDHDGAQILAVGATKGADLLVVQYGDEDTKGGACGKANAEFIVAARKAVPALIAEVKRLRAGGSKGCAQSNATGLACTERDGHAGSCMVRMDDVMTLFEDREAPNA